MAKQTKDQKYIEDLIRQHNKLELALKWMCIVAFGCFMCTLLILVGNIQKQAVIDSLPPQKLGAVYYDGEGSAWIRFDLTDQRQQSLVKSLEVFCKENNIQNCMNALDILEVR